MRGDNSQWQFHKHTTFFSLMFLLDDHSGQNERKENNEGKYEVKRNRTPERRFCRNPSHVLLQTRKSCHFRLENFRWDVPFCRNLKSSLYSEVCALYKTASSVVVFLFFFLYLENHVVSRSVPFEPTENLSFFDFPKYECLSWKQLSILNRTRRKEFVFECTYSFIANWASTLR